MVDGLKIPKEGKTITMTVSSLSQYDHGAIHQLLKDGCSQRQIATQLDLSASTINYELNRVSPYDPY